MSEEDPTFFPEAADFRAWLEEHHRGAPEKQVASVEREHQQCEGQARENCAQDGTLPEPLHASVSLP